MSCRSPSTVPMTAVCGAFCAALGHQRLEDGQRGLHGVGGDEHLGNEDLVALEALAHDRHARHQPLLDDGAGFLAIFKALLCQGRGSGLVTIDDGLRQRMDLSHERDLPSL